MKNCNRDIGTTGEDGENRSSCSVDGCSRSVDGYSCSVDGLSSRYKLSTEPCTRLVFIHSNCQSAMNKGSEISGLIDEQKPHVLALTEFGAGSTVTDGELGIEGYTLYRGNHSSGRGGLGKGAAVYVVDTLNHSACPEFDNMGFDCSTWFTVKLSDRKTLLVGVVYRSPNSSVENNDRLLAMLRLAATIQCDYLTLCGDYNLPRIDWDAHRCYDSEESYGQAFLNVIEELNLFQHATKPSRFRGEQRSCLDLIFTNEEDMVNEVNELPPLGKSDHVCQRWQLIVSETHFRNTVVQRRNFRRADWSNVKSDMRGFRIDPNDSPSCVNDKLVEMLNNTKARNVPFCRPQSRKHRLPWMKGSSLKARRTAKWRSWKKFKRTGLLIDYDAYKFERNRLNDAIRSAKMSYERRLITGMKENPNLYHGHCRRTLKTKQGVSNVVDGNGRLTETEVEAADALSTYYRTVFTEDDPQIPTPGFPTRTQEKLDDIKFDVESVQEQLTNLNPNKAAGPDEIESKLLKECSEEMAPILCQVFRKSMDEGEVPNGWKEAHIIPIHKKGNKAVMANFRPVALTSVISKVFEKIICAAIVCFLTRNNLITQQQHGFVRGRSCQTNILLCLERWTESLDNNKSVDVAYFDYAKAFDKVSHRLLLVKLKAYGIGGRLLAWLEAYLRDRKQRVVVGNAKSSWAEVISGTTQGTVLGFILFLIFINDLPTECSPEDESLIALLADDTKAYQEIDDDVSQHQANQHELQSRVDKIAQWAKKWRMEINPTKSKIMHIGRNNPGLPYNINGTQIDAVAVEKDIGFWITDDLSPSTHVHKARSKALGEISRIRRNFTLIDKKAFCVLYNQRIRPHLDHGMAACPPRTSAESNLLERVQSKATALVHGMKHLNSEERRRKLGLMKLEERRERGDLIEVFKMLKGHTRIDPTVFWEVRDARGGARLVKELAANGRRQRQSFFSYRVVQKWNLLPTDLKMAPSLEAFKNRLDEMILNRA